MEGPGVTYQFHRHLQVAYSSVYTWLETQRILNYRTIDFAGIKRSLYGDTLEDCANVYHGFFPAHHFKVLHTLETVVGYDRILGWLRHNPHICIVDIGCGAGAGSSAVIGTILRLRDEGLLTQPMEVLCGVVNRL